MNEQHPELIRKCQAQIIQAIVDSQCLEWLINQLLPRDQSGFNGLTWQDLFNIKGGYYANEAEKIRVFLEILCARGHKAIDRFFKVIIDTKHARLISILTSQLPPNRQTGTERTSNTFNNQNNQGRMVGGPVHGGIVVQGNYYAYPHKTRQVPSTSSSSLSQPSSENWQHKLETAQQSLKEMYSKRFQKVYPFSLPFTFDIENTWVSLALKEEKKDSEATEDHAELLTRAFDKVKMLIIEGDPATGKTSLMRRLAYEWANGKQELLHYALVLYTEFREVREETFQSIVDLVLGGLEKYLTKKCYGNLKKLVNNERFCKEYRILVLLDGYDESSLEKQCSEFSSYVKEKTINQQLFFNTAITTRKGYLSNLRGHEGRFVFAEVLGFTTKQQKEKYIFNHFKSAEFDNKRNIAAVYNLLNKNENLNKLAETPLFLTFICLIHERIVDGTLLELYCNIIWWLIDRHQQDFPDRDIPALFGYQNGSSDKFETIQDHYLHFPQLHCLGNMALCNLERDKFKPSDYDRFNLQPIIEQVGLLRKEKQHDELFKLTTSIFFPHRTVQEFLAAFYCFCSNDPTSKQLRPYSDLDTSRMNEFDFFLFRIALSDKMPVQAEKRKYYFERITDINLDITFDAFNTTARFNNKLLNWGLSQCTNVQSIDLYGEVNSAEHARNTLIDTSLYNESNITPSQALFSFSDLIKLHSLTFGDGDVRCTFAANSQLSFTNCPSLKNLTFNRCEMKSITIAGIATLPAIDTVQIDRCNIDMATWQSVTDQISNSSVKCLQLIFGADFNKEFLIHLQKCDNIERMEITRGGYTIRQNDLLSFSHLINLHSLTFDSCTFSANSQLSFTNCPSLKILKFRWCEIESSTNLGIATLPAVDTVQFYDCTIDLATWESITDDIGNSSVKCLHLSANFFAEGTYHEFLHHLQKCERIQQIHVYDVDDFDDYILINEKEVTENLALAAQRLPALMSIAISDRLSEWNRERIEKAGQQRNPHFSIRYVKEAPDQ